MQRIPCVLMRGGTSRGPIFLRSDLPADDSEVDSLLIRALGTMSALQVDGVGGGHPLTSKVAIVSRSTSPDADIDYSFVQVDVARPRVDRRPNCGNMLSAVGPYAIEAGLVKPTAAETRVRIRNTNTDTFVEAIIQTPGGRVQYDGAFVLDGVAGSAAPIRLVFANAAKASNRLFPTGNVVDVIDGTETTLVNGAIPVMVVRARDIGLDGAGSPAELDGLLRVRERIEQLRLGAGLLMGLGDVSGSVVPKVAIVSPPRNGGTLTVRYLTPIVTHTAMAVTGAVTLTRALMVPRTLPAQEASIRLPSVMLEHPAGNMPLQIERDGTSDLDPASARIALVRTARRIFDGHIYVPDAPVSQPVQFEKETT